MATEFGHSCSLGTSSVEKAKGREFQSHSGKYFHSPLNKQLLLYKIRANLSIRKMKEEHRKTI